MKHFLLFEKRGVMKARHLACSDRKVKKKSHLIYNLNFSMCACTNNVMSVAVSIGTIKITFFIEAPQGCEWETYYRMMIFSKIIFSFQSQGSKTSE